MTTVDTDPVVQAQASLFRKIAQVMGEVGNVPKNGYNSFHKYKYVQEADLVEAIRMKLAAHNVAVIPSLGDVVERPCKSGSKDSIVTTARVAFTFVDGDTGAMFKSEWAGQGEDPTDKGLYSAYTGALKYFLMKTFLVSTGDDPERDKGSGGNSYAAGVTVPVPQPTPPRPTADPPAPTEELATPEQRRMLNARAADAKLSERSYKGVVKAITGSTIVDRIPQRLVDAVKDTLEIIGRTPEDFGEEPLVRAITIAYSKNGGKPFGSDTGRLIKEILDAADVPF